MLLRRACFLAGLRAVSTAGSTQSLMQCLWPVPCHCGILHEWIECTGFTQGYIRDIRRLIFPCSSCSFSICIRATIQLSRLAVALCRRSLLTISCSHSRNTQRERLLTFNNRYLLAITSTMMGVRYLSNPRQPLEYFIGALMTLLSKPACEVFLRGGLDCR